MSKPMAELLEGLRDGAVRVVDLTQPLSEETPVIELPPEMEPIPGLKMHPGPQYGDQLGAWFWFEVGEHVGTHFDAPTHWYTGKGLTDVSRVPAEHLMAPVVVPDRTAAAEVDEGLILTMSDLRGLEDEIGGFPAGSWLVVRTGWGARAADRERFLNSGSGKPVWPGFDVDASRWLALESGVIGIGVETVGIDAGCAYEFDPVYPTHHYMLGADKYGLTQLANVDQLPTTGALIVVAPLKLVGGTGSPSRVLALVPTA